MNQWILLCLLTKIYGEGYLEGQKWLKAVSPNPTSSLTIAHENWKPGVHYTTWRQTIQQIWEYPFQVARVVWSYSSHLGWSLPLSGSSSCLGIIWEAHLSQSVFKQFLHLTHAGGGPNESGHFQGLSQFILSSCHKLNELPHSMEHFTSL